MCGAAYPATCTVQLAQNIYDLANKWAKRVQCKELCDLKLLACRLQWHVVVSVSECHGKPGTSARVPECEPWESASKRVKKAANNLARCLPPAASESRIDNARLQEKLKSQEDGCARAEILAKLCTSFCHTATAYQHEVCSRFSTSRIRMNIRRPS
jgi:hypothetical protein